MDHESDGDTNCNWSTRYSHHGISTGTGGLENKRTTGDHPNYGIVEIGQNTEKSPGDLRRLAGVKTSQMSIIIIIIIIIIISLIFSHECQLGIFHWSLTDNKSPQVSRVLLSILVDLSRTVVCRLLILSLIYNLTSLFSIEVLTNCF